VKHSHNIHILELFQSAGFNWVLIAYDWWDCCAFMVLNVTMFYSCSFPACTQYLLVPTWLVGWLNNHCVVSESSSCSGEMLVGLLWCQPTWEQDMSSKHFIELPLHLFSNLSLSLKCIFFLLEPFLSQASLQCGVYLSPWRIPSTLVCWTCSKPTENIPNRGEPYNHRLYCM